MRDGAESLRKSTGPIQSEYHFVRFSFDVIPWYLLAPAIDALRPISNTGDIPVPDVLPQTDSADIVTGRVRRPPRVAPTKSDVASTVPQALRSEGPERRKAYRINEAARLLSISRSTMYKMESAGSLKMIHVGGRTLVTDVEIERLLSADNQ